jgi:S-DNA-T family DNA segregation ATPase FtsK/SpoIIIE
MTPWRRMKARIAYRREKAKTQKHTAPEFSGFCLAALSLLGFFCTLWPRHAGVAGAMLARAVLQAFGQCAFLLWALIIYRGVRLILHREERRPWRYVFVDALLVVSACALVTSFGQIFLNVNPGGHAGKFAAQLFIELFGRWGGLFISGAALGAVLMWRSGTRPGQVVHWVWQRLLSDWREWRQAVQVDKTKTKEVAPKKALPKVMKPSPPQTPVESKSKPTVVSQAIPSPSLGRRTGEGRDEGTLPLKKPALTPALSRLPTGEGEKTSEPAVPFIRPALELLTEGDRNPVMTKESDLLASAQHLEKTLADFGVQGKVVEIHPGPIITRFDFTPAPGIKVQAVSALANDIALAMKAMSVRVVAPIPGKSAVGIELPNPKRAIVRLREVLESPEFQNHPSKLALGLGKDAEGHPVIADLASMPHLLIAGSTGAGKSVCIHALVMSIMFRSTPQEVKILMIDPKRLELPLYNGIPYLFDPNQNPENCRVITDPKEAAKALEGVIKVMDHRFKKFAAASARDIGHYNEKMADEGGIPESYLVIIIDELADLMAVAAKEVEISIQRLAQMARAVGIHLVLATQRPSVDVITGVIKANLPSRIAFRVASQTDSRVILDSSGAESLLGQGDMLFLPPGAPKPNRLQCGLVTTKEVQTIADFVRAQGAPSYERVLTPTASARGADGSEGGEYLDDLQQAMMLVLERKRVSQDLLKAHFGSSARATDLLSQLEIKGFIAKPEGTNRWTIYFDRIDAYLGQIKNQANQTAEQSS